MTLAATTAPDVTSLRRHGALGLALVGGLCGGLLCWAGVTPLSGAVVAPGVVVVESYLKAIQHQDGGTIEGIYVNEGDLVEAGQLLIRLDATGIRASLSLVLSQLQEGLTRESRLLAQVNRTTTFSTPQELDEGDPGVAALLDTERRVLDAHLASQSGRIGQLNEQIAQIEREISGVIVQREAVTRQLDIGGEQLDRLESLRRDKLIEASRVNDVRMQVAGLEGELGRLAASIAKAQATIAERGLQIAEIETEFLSTSLRELQETRQLISRAREQRITIDDRLKATEIRAPQAGTVHELAVHTVGGVVAAGETLMQIVPHGDRLMVAAQFSPNDIDKVDLSQSVHIRFPGLDQRRVPELIGSIAGISADLVTAGPETSPFYSVRISIASSELARLPAGTTLIPGMPAEAFAETGERTVLSYLLQPVVDHMVLAFRED